VKRDFEMYSPLVRKGGVIAFHDIAAHHPGSDRRVNEFWEEIKHSYKHREIIDNPTQDWAGINLLYV
jgi:hypothetical protein